MTPAYPLKTVKRLLKANHYRINDDVLLSLANDLRWGPEEVVNCLLKLNDRPYQNNPLVNHFYKTKKHKHIPHTMMDYYKIRNAPEDLEIYTHFYIRKTDNKLVISSFKELIE